MRVQVCLKKYRLAKQPLLTDYSQKQGALYCVPQTLQGLALFAFMLKNTLLSRECKNVFTLDAIMKEKPREYQNFLDAMERGDMQEIYSKWRRGEEVFLKI